MGKGKRGERKTKCSTIPSLHPPGTTKLQDANSIGLLLLLSRFSHVQLCATPRTVACQAPLSMGVSWQELLEWIAMPSSRGSNGFGIARYPLSMKSHRLLEN